MDRLRVGVTGISAGDNPGPGIGVARSLKEDPDLKVEIVGLAYDAMDPGIYMDWLIDKAFTLPYPSSNGRAYLSRLMYIRDSHGLDVVIPNLDAELPIFIRYADELSRSGVSTFLPSMRQFQLRGKDRLADVAKATGLRFPRSALVSSEEMVFKAIERLKTPVVVKGIFSEAHRAHTPQEAVFHYRNLVAKWGCPAIVQEVVSGNELNVVGLGDGRGGVLGLLGIKKLTLTSLGKVWSAVTVKNPAMLEAAATFAQQYRWRGPFEMECIVAGNDTYLIEINPRFPAWVYFATGVGTNLPAKLLRCSLGLPVSTAHDYTAGKMLVRYSYEIVTEMQPFQAIATRGETP